MYPDWESNWQPFGSQAGAQSTKPHEPGQILLLNANADNAWRIRAGRHKRYSLAADRLTH